MKIRSRVEGATMTATLEDTQTARDVLSLLPLSVLLEDYASTGKIAVLPRKLSTDGAPAGTDARGKRHRVPRAVGKPGSTWSDAPTRALAAVPGRVPVDSAEVYERRAAASSTQAGFRAASPGRTGTRTRSKA